MKKTLKSAVIGTVLALGVMQAQAKLTNEVHVSTFAVTVWTQGGTNIVGKNAVVTANKTRLANKDFLSLLTGLTVSYASGSNTVTVSNVTFSTKAALILKGAAGGVPTFYVRDLIGTNVVDYNISAYLNFTQSGTSVLSGHEDQAGDKSFTKIEVLNLNFNDGKPSLTAFSVSGLATVKIATLKDKVAGLVQTISGIGGTLAGTGTFDGTPAIGTGTFAVGTAKIEIK